MAASTISGEYGFVKQITVILKEGNITVNTSGYGPFGKQTVCTLASEINQGDPVALSADTANTYDATGGLFVVAPLANGVNLPIGHIIDEPKWVRQPATTQSTWSSMLSGKYYRIATVELYIPMTIHMATLVCDDKSAITPGTLDKISIVASASTALHGLSIVDVASGGGNNIIPLTYAAKAASTTVSVLVGIIGFGTVVT